MDNGRVKRHSHDDDDDYDYKHRHSSSRDSRRHIDRWEHREGREIKDRADDDGRVHDRKVEDGNRFSSYQAKEKDKDPRSHRDSVEKPKRSYERRDNGEGDRDNRPHKRREREREDGDGRKEKRHRVAAADDDGDDGKARDRGEKRKFQENDSKTKDDDEEYRHEKRHASGRVGGGEHYGDAKQRVNEPGNGSASASFNTHTYNWQRSS